MQIQQPIGLQKRGESNSVDYNATEKKENEMENSKICLHFKRSGLIVVTRIQL